MLTWIVFAFRGIGSETLEKILEGEQEKEEDVLKGECAEGYGGFMCMDCLYSYSRSADFICTKCANLALAVFLLILAVIAMLAFLILILKSFNISLTHL